MNENFHMEKNLSTAKDWFPEKKHDDALSSPMSSCQSLALEDTEDEPCIRYVNRNNLTKEKKGKPEMSEGNWREKQYQYLRLQMEDCFGDQEKKPVQRKQLDIAQMQSHSESRAESRPESHSKVQVRLQPEPWFHPDEEVFKLSSRSSWKKTIRTETYGSFQFSSQKQKHQGPTDKASSCSHTSSSVDDDKSSWSSEEYSDHVRPRKRNTHSPKGNLYKTELCRSYVEMGNCKYGTKCQFAHGVEELKPIKRHPKYKTKYCRNFTENGTCPYGSRCRFIHRDAVESIEDISSDLQAIFSNLDFQGKNFTPENKTGLNFFESLRK